MTHFRKEFHEEFKLVDVYKNPTCTLCDNKYKREQVLLMHLGYAHCAVKGRIPEADYEFLKGNTRSSKGPQENEENEG